MLSPSVIVKLRAAAIEASKHAYCPYSEFAVGAAVLTESGKIYSGCNVENVSYGLTMCAERSAVFQAVAQGAGTIRAIALYSDTEKPITPCGACRQVISEFGPDATVYCCSSVDDCLEFKLSELLPSAFGPRNPAMDIREP